MAEDGNDSHPSREEHHVSPQEAALLSRQNKVHNSLGMSADEDNDYSHPSFEETHEALQEVALSSGQIQLYYSLDTAAAEEENDLRPSLEERHEASHEAVALSLGKNKMHDSLRISTEEEMNSHVSRDEQQEASHPSREEQGETPYPSSEEQKEAPQEAALSLMHNSQHEAETGQLAEELAERLQAASTVLLDRLFECLSRLPSEESTSTERPTGLTLPASAIGWLSTQLYPQIYSLAADQDHCSDDHALWMGSSMRERLALLKRLLPRVKYVRVTSEEWPPSRQAKSISSPQPQNFVGQDVDADAMSVHSGLTMESVVPPRPSLRSFLFQFYLLQNRPRVDLQLFPCLTVLLMDKVPPEWVINLHSVRDSLELLRTERGCIYDLSNFLFPINQGNDKETQLSKELPVFGRLTHLKLTNCVIGELSGLRGKTTSASHGEVARIQSTMDENGSMISFHNLLEIPPPLSRLPNLVSLSLAHNDLRSARTALAGLSYLPNLRRLDLSYNYLTHMRGANVMLGNIKVLILTGNRIRTVQGLDRLYSLERLSLDKNKLTDLASVAGLANLPELKWLKMTDNPIAKLEPKRYRVELFNLFRERRFVGFPPTATYRHLLEVLPLLDGKQASKTELVGLRGFAFSQSVGQVDTATLSDKTSSALETSMSNDEFHEFRSILLPPVGATIRSNRVSRLGKPRKVVIFEGEMERLEVRSILDQCGTNQAVLKDDGDVSRHVHFSLTDVITALPKLTPGILDEDENFMDTPGEEAGDFSIGSLCAENEVAQALPGALGSMMKRGKNSGDPTPLGPRNDVSINTKDLSLLSLSPIMNEEIEEGIMTRTHGDVETSAEFESQSNPQSPRHTVEEGGCLVVQSTVSNSDDFDPVEHKNGETPASTKETLQVQSDGESSSPSIRGYVASSSSPDRSDKFIAMLPHTPEVIFPEDVWDDDTSAISSIKTNTLKTARANSRYQEAEAASAYDGPENLKGLHVLDNLELYFRGFVFRISLSDTYIPYQEEPSDEEKMKLLLNVAPRIQLRPTDWRCLESTVKSSSPTEIFATCERFEKVWRENALACGKLATKRLSPHRKPKRGFHGDVLFENGRLGKSCERRNLIICTSDSAIYFISDYDAVTRYQLSKTRKRRFPLPIPEDSLFESGPWPHALARHPIAALERITIGFGFQRLTLHFRSDEGSGAKDSEGFAYILLTGNKLKTINVLQHLQSLTKDLSSHSSTKPRGEALKFDNDDRQVLDSLSTAVAPSSVGVVRHYQIVQQRWQHGDRGTVRRACVVTDCQIYLLDEDYVGDGSESFEAGARQLGEVCFKLVDSAEIEQVSEVQAGLDDPNSVTIFIRPLSKLQRYHRWRLVCHDREGAERLIEDLRKAIQIEM